MPVSSRSIARAAVAVAALVVASCGGGGVKLHPVSGKVFYLDQPAEGATVVFQPLNSTADSLMPSGKVGADGSFTLSTHPHGEGAPAGEYVALVTWYPPNARELDNPKNKLSPKYSSQADSPFRVTIKQGANELEPFRLTK